MGLFGNKMPKLPSYVGVGLDDLLQDPEWTQAIGQAGLDPKNCEIVLRLAETFIGSGDLPENARPAILLGQGNTLAIAFPTEREVKVQTRDKSRAALQTQRSGFFQIIFGHAERLDLFGFWGYEDNLKLGTPEGETFGKVMSAFLMGKLGSRQIYGTPQSLVGNATTLESPGPHTDDPQDALRRIQGTVQITPELMSEARRFMEEWTHIVGQAPDEVFWPALSRFGRMGGALQGAELLAIEDGEELGRVLDRPWQTWLAVGQKGLEGGDLELTVRVFFFAYVMVEQVGFDADITARCGYMEPKDETYRAIAAQALAAADRAPDGWAVVERATSARTTKAQLQSGLRSLLGQ